MSRLALLALLALAACGAGGAPTRPPAAAPDGSAPVSVRGDFSLGLSL